MAKHAGMDDFGDLPTVTPVVKAFVGVVVAAIVIGAVLYSGVF